MFREIRKKYIRYIVLSLYFIILFFCAMEVNFLWLFGSSPTRKDILNPNMRIASELYTADGKLLGRYYRENRSPVAYEKISPDVINALIATEDVRFYQHSGIDLRSLISSTISTASGDKRGASTITQQVAKNLYRTRYTKSQGLIRYIPVLRTVIFKLKEWTTAFKLESIYSKKDILTLYLNTVAFGNNTYGIKTAAKRYFNRDPDKLRIEESATLIGMLKGTSTYNPVNNPEAALRRRNVVLSQMRKYNYITDAQFKADTLRPLKISAGNMDDDNQGDSYLRNAVSRFIDGWCKDNDIDLYEDGLKIYTTIDSKLQGYAEQAVKEQMRLLQIRFNNLWGDKNPWRDSKGVEIPNFIENAVQKLSLYKSLAKKYASHPDSVDYYLNKKKPMKVFSWDGDKEVSFSTIDSVKYYVKLLNTGMMTLDPFSGKIKVWVGGTNFNYFKYDHVNQAKRQAGSTFKPFAYLAALESGMSPCDTFIDKRVSIPYQENGKTEVWEPNNADFNFSGRKMSLRWAMAKSVNSITAQVTEKVGWDNVVKAAHTCGIESELKSVPSVSLGPNDVSVFEMVKAYGTFLNKGIRTDPILVEKITDHDGNLLQEFKPERKRALTEEIAWLMIYMFRGGMEEPEGTSQALWAWEDLFKHDNQIGGKTGTSSDYVDGWYMGITKDLVTGIWVGCDDRSIHFTTSESGEGSHTALPIFAKFMDKVYKDPSTGITQGKFPKPGVKIERSYYCPTPYYPKADTTAADSLSADSLLQTPADPAAEPASSPPPGGVNFVSSGQKGILPGQKNTAGRLAVKFKSDQKQLRSFLNYKL